MFGLRTRPRAGLTTDPQHVGGSGRGTSTAHATYSGDNIAVCGAPTPFLGKAWPKEAKYWNLTYWRCPACAHQMYALKRH